MAHTFEIKIVKPTFKYHLLTKFKIYNNRSHWMSNKIPNGKSNILSTTLYNLFTNLKKKKNLN